MINIDEYIDSMDKALVEMEEAIAGIEKEGGISRSEFFKVHMVGIKQVMVLGLTYKNLPDGCEEKEQVRKQLLELCVVLGESLEVLKLNK